MKTAVTLFIGMLGATSAYAEWFSGAESAFIFDSNVPRAQRKSDIRSDSALVLRASGGYYLQASERTGVTLSANAEREEHLRYSGLSYIGFGPSASVRTKLGLGAAAPWLRLSTSALRLEYDDDTRTGWLLALTGAAGARVSERIDLRAELRLERRSADRKQALVAGIPGDVFDLDSASASVSGDYLLSRATSLSLGYAYRVGDVVSSTRRNRAIFAASAAISLDPVFAPDTIAYKLGAHSHVFDLRLSHALGERASLNLGLGRSLTYGDGGNNYYSSNVSASVLYNF